MIDHVPPGVASVKAALGVVPHIVAEPPAIAATVGDALTVKVDELVPVPHPLLTLTVPVVPLPITATRVVPLFEVIEVTGVPPICTLAAVAPSRLVPVIVIVVVPAQPLLGVNEVIVGFDFLPSNSHAPIS